MSNHAKFLDHVILISWIFFEIFTSGSYHRNMKALRILASNSWYLNKMANWCASNDVLNTAISLITSVSNNVWS